MRKRKTETKKDQRDRDVGFTEIPRERKTYKHTSTGWRKRKTDMYIHREKIHRGRARDRRIGEVYTEKETEQKDRNGELEIERQEGENRVNRRKD